MTVVALLLEGAPPLGRNLAAYPSVLKWCAAMRALPHYAEVGKPKSDSIVCIMPHVCTCPHIAAIRIRPLEFSIGRCTKDYLRHAWHWTREEARLPKPGCERSTQPCYAHSSCFMDYWMAMSKAAWSVSLRDGAVLPLITMLLTQQTHTANSQPGACSTSWSSNRVDQKWHSKGGAFECPRGG